MYISATSFLQLIIPWKILYKVSGRMSSEFVLCNFWLGLCVVLIFLSVSPSKGNQSSSNQLNEMTFHNDWNGRNGLRNLVNCLQTIDVSNLQNVW